VVKDHLLDGSSIISEISNMRTVVIQGRPDHTHRTQLINSCIAQYRLFRILTSIIIKHKLLISWIPVCWCILRASNNNILYLFIITWDKIWFFFLTICVWGFVEGLAANSCYRIIGIVWSLNSWTSTVCSSSWWNDVLIRIIVIWLIFATLDKWWLRHFLKL